MYSNLFCKFETYTELQKINLTKLVMLTCGNARFNYLLYVDDITFSSFYIMHIESLKFFLHSKIIIH